MAIKHLLPRDARRPAPEGRTAREWQEFAASFEQLLAGVWLPAKRALMERGLGLGPGPQGLPWVPEVDVRETATEIVVEAALPGLEKNDIRVDVDADRLSIRGRREPPAKNGGATREEQAHGYFCRRFPLPAEIKPAQVKARYAGGILTVTLPKARRASRSVKVE